MGLRVIVSTSKGSTSTNLDNQQGVALESATRKLLNAILRNRLFPDSTFLLRLQSGFRPGISAVKQIAAILLVIDTCRTRQQAVSMIFEKLPSICTSIIDRSLGCCMLTGDFLLS